MKQNEMKALYTYITKKINKYKKDLQNYRPCKNEYP